MKKTALALAVSVFLTALPAAPPAYAGDALQLETPSALLMEAETGTILYEKDAHERLRPASITKIMTMLLIFEALESGRISLTDEVTVSEHAAGMGGSQVFLEPGETQTVDTMLKCISIASANDACVAMAEFVSGTEEAFVAEMNQRAAELGMNDTSFVNACGLEAEGHLTSAFDIALMARELSVKHPQVFDYCQIWMDTITHKTKKGESEFGLTNTNKLIRYYSYATGLKTGYTSQSKYCLAATATRDDVDLIAVVMAEQSPTIRNKEAIALLDYGFAHCKLYRDDTPAAADEITVRKGTTETVPVERKSSFSYVITDGSGSDAVTRTEELSDELSAPVRKGERVGSISYRLGDTLIGTVDLVAADTVEKRTFRDCVRAVFSASLRATTAGRTDAAHSGKAA